MFADLLRSIASQATLLEGTAVLFGLLSVYLSTRQNIWSWPTAIVNVSLFVLIFYRTKLYADAGLQVFFLVLSIYGWYEWLYGGKNRTTLQVSRLDARTAVVLCAIGAAGSMALGTFFSRSTDASLPYLDSTLSVFSLVAQWMMTRKILENWVLWIILDVVYVWMFIALKDLNFTAFQYAVFLILAAMGYRDWKRSYAGRRVLATA